MTWRPAKKEVFDQILREEVAALTPEAAIIYEKYHTSPCEQPCLRGDDYGLERVFVVARNGERLVFFNDVEEEFCVGVADGDGILRELSTYGPLVAAMLALVGDSV